MENAEKIKDFSSCILDEELENIRFDFENLTDNLKSKIKI